MNSNITAALIAAGISIISLIITVIFNILSRKKDYDNLYAKTVSSNRMDWINTFRDSISTLLAVGDVLNNNFINQSQQNYACEKVKFYKSKYNIITRLNLDEDIDRTLLKLLEILDPQSNDYKLKRELLLSLTRQKLKPEWERVKEEAKGEK